MGKLVSSARARAAIAGAMMLAASVGGVWVAKAPDGKTYPLAVTMAADTLIKPWEQERLIAYLDSVRVPTICFGETKGVYLGMKKTHSECVAMLYRRVNEDFYIPLTLCAAGFERAPDPVQASMVSGAYNFGVVAWCRSTAARMIRAARYRDACQAQTAFNRAGGEVLTGLVRRREMGDAQRIGEGELCVSGLK
ncbi:lysozyme [Pleomorphomonas sp. PLEO]|uniref:lysozyme n=1 Tax=Pleomorphomonas sp. PLEO TaxID=3239306 RepID=UPI00351F24A7